MFCSHCFLWLWGRGGKPYNGIFKWYGCCRLEGAKDVHIYSAMLGNAVTAVPGEPHWPHQYLGVPCCQAAFKHVLGVKSHKKFYQFMEALKAGSPTPPTDQRKGNPAAGRPCKVKDGIDQFLMWAYTSLGQWLPDQPEDQHPNASRDFPELPDTKKDLPFAFQDWDVLRNASSAAVEPNSCRRYLPNMTLTSLHGMMRSRGVEGSLRQLQRLYNDSWADKLRFQRTGQGAQCNDCARYKQLKKNAITAAEVVRPSYFEHFDPDTFVFAFVWVFVRQYLVSSGFLFACIC
jgi:hypothetical protein